MLSALLLLLAFPPFDIWPLVFVALVPLLLQLQSADSKSAGRDAFLFGWLLFLGQMFWLYSLAVHWTHSPLLGLIPWILSSLIVAAFFVWLGRLVRACYVRNWLWLIPIVWAGVEVGRSYLPVVAFPWGLMATPLYRAPLLIQSAHFGTIYLVSAMVVLVNVLVAGVFVPEHRHRLKPLVVAFFALLALSAFQLRAHAPSTPFALTVGQPGVDLAFGNHVTGPAQLAANIDGFTASALADGSQLLVLPEGIYQDDVFPPRPDFRIDKRLPVLFGGQRGKGPIYQTAFSFDGRWHFEDKTRLVIFGEFVPGRSSFPWIAKEFDLPTEDLSASKKGIISVDVAGIKAGPMLCFEGLFPEVSYQHAVNGSKLITVMCIDDWYMGTSAPEQLKAASIFRAVETGLPLVRSASLGYSLGVDGHGNILAELPLKATAALRLNIDLPKESPLFPLLPVFPVLALLVALALPWLGLVKKGTNEADSGSPQQADSQT